MINPIEKVRVFFHSIEPDDLSVKVLSLIPIICNIFLEVKKNQLLDIGEQENLKKIALTVKDWRVGQLILIPYIAKQLEKMTFKQRLLTFSGLTIVVVIHEAHLEGITGDTP
jgi:hypothetical protein